MQKLPLLLNAVPKVNMQGPKVFLEDGTWTIKADRALQFKLRLNSESEIEKSSNEFMVYGPTVVNVIVMSESKERVSIFATKQ